jgi:hypothetical protein
MATAAESLSTDLKGDTISPNKGTNANQEQNFE